MFVSGDTTSGRELHLPRQQRGGRRGVQTRHSHHHVSVSHHMIFLFLKPIKSLKRPERPKCPKVAKVEK